MPRRLVRISLAFAVFLSAQAFALGLGEIRIGSALNEPLRAEIELLSATPEELDGLKVALAAEATFDRYGLDRPFYLTELEFRIVRSGRSDGNVVQVTSSGPITEPFLTFLVEATWSSGRLLREYTVLLDPPTFAPPAASQPSPVVAAPQRTEPADSGRIERTPPPPPVEPEPQAETPAPVRPATTPAPSEPASVEPAYDEPAYEEPETVADEAPYAGTPGGDVLVQRGDTLWGIASRMRPDSRLSMNQTMLAIFNANPEAFGGNMNMLRAGASLRMPSADEIFSIDRGDAFREAQRQHAEWDGGYVARPAPTVAEPAEPSLQLVPPDEDLTAYDDGTAVDTDADAEPLTREQEVLDRIAELEAEDVADNPGLIAIRDNELASLRAELAAIRGEVYEPPVEEPIEEPVAEDPFAAGDETGDAAVDEDADAVDQEPVAADEDVTAEPVAEPPAPAPVRRAPSLMDRIIGWLTSTWAIIAGAALVVVGILLWFLRRRKGEEDIESFQPLEELDEESGRTGGTQSLRVPDRSSESFVVVEQDDNVGGAEPTIESPAFSGEFGEQHLGTFGSLEDTFSSDTAVNLDQADPIAEADFHMAYGLYDQAAELINMAIDSEPGRQDLISKLCEIYFVWGNRDGFIDAANRLKQTVGDNESAEWDKIVIMGQQIAGDHALFAGAGTAAATKVMDLSFDSPDDGGGALDMEFGEEPGEDNVIDLGADTAAAAKGDDGIDYVFDPAETSTNDSNVLEMDFDFSADAAEESATTEQPAAGSGGTTRMPAFEESTDSGLGDSSVTTEIDLDDLGLEIGDLEETGTNATLMDAEEGIETGVNPELKDIHAASGDDLSATAIGELVKMEEDPSLTGSMRLAPDETGLNPLIMPADEAADIDLGDELLDATETGVLSEDFAVDTASGSLIGDDEATLLASDEDAAAAPPAGDEDETLLAGLDEDDVDFDFAKTEALPPDAFIGEGSDVDQTAELPIAGADVDFDLDDLTSALQVNAGDDTVEMPSSDATMAQPRPNFDDTGSLTVSLSPDEFGDDLDDARTMTEVGTKLDLARAYVDMGDPGGARSILEEVLDEGDDSQRQQAQSLLDTLAS